MDNTPRLKITAEKPHGALADVELDGKPLKVTGIDLEVRADAITRATLFMHPRHIEVDVAAKLGVVNQEWWIRKAAANEAERELRRLHDFYWCSLHLAEPLDDMGQWWRLSIMKDRPGEPYQGTKIEWHKDTPMTPEKIVSVVKKASGQLSEIDERAIWIYQEPRLVVIDGELVFGTGDPGNPGEGDT